MLLYQISKAYFKPSRKLVTTLFVRDGKILFSHQTKQFNLNLKKCSHGQNDHISPGKPFSERHIGPNSSEQQEMLKYLGYKSIEDFIKTVINSDIRASDLKLPTPLSEYECLKEIKEIGSENIVFRSYIGNGYYNTIIPPAIIRNVLENPGWYTPYTPYQAEISQGRLELLFNYQSMITNLTGMELTNASLLDEASACAEAITMAVRLTKRTKILISGCSEDQNEIVPDIFSHSYGALTTRALALGCSVEILTFDQITNYDLSNVACVIFQYPNQNGNISIDLSLNAKLKKEGVLSICATDPMSLVLLQPPGALGFDITYGSMQRFGVPLGYGGPHAAFLASKNSDELVRCFPGRIVGLTRDADGNKCYRLSKQTREQHIRREKATSNICTAQALLANISTLYAMYHGPSGLKEIAQRIHNYTTILQYLLKSNGYITPSAMFFDSIKIKTDAVTIKKIKKASIKKKINFRYNNFNEIFISLDETVNDSDIRDILSIFECKEKTNFKLQKYRNATQSSIEGSPFARTKLLLENPIFNNIHSETQLLRYIKSLENKDISLCNSMIPLGSCTMKLNAAAELRAFLWKEYSDIHPFAPVEQTQGYTKLIGSLAELLQEITGMDGCSFQGNSGAQGEYNGLLTIKRYLTSINQNQRNLCLIPVSAHGTNPASAALVGFEVKPILTTENGSVEFSNLKNIIEENKNRLACMMITFPSTYGMFESNIKDVCKLVHDNGGQIYLDGANMNAQVGLCKPGQYDIDVCHLNLHKTFAIPHGGGGPGAGPILVKKHLMPFLCHHPSISETSSGSISSGPFGSASILTIPWSYIRMMGATGLKRASEVAILNSNYAAKVLSQHYDILFLGKNLNMGHEFIISLKKIHQKINIDSVDVAKRLMDYGFHAPTLSWPVPHSLMIEPTESEDKRQIDRYCDALINIRKEIAQIENGTVDKNNNLLKNSPHTLSMVANTNWNYSYTREEAAFPLNWVKENKIWPSCRRVDDVYGDRNFCCAFS